MRLPHGSRPQALAIFGWPFLGSSDPVVLVFGLELAGAEVALMAAVFVFALSRADLVVARASFLVTNVYEVLAQHAVIVWAHPNGSSAAFFAC